jgi:hypothetical protein
MALAERVSLSDHPPAMSPLSRAPMGITIALLCAAPFAACSSKSRSTATGGSNATGGSPPDGGKETSTPEPVCEGGADILGAGGAPSAGAVLPAACMVGAQVCNPFDATGCHAQAGETCDLAPDGTFQCFGGANVMSKGAACDGLLGPFCAAGLTCGGVPGTATCARFCCADGDCDAGETCAELSATGASKGGVGACVALVSDGGSDGGSDASVPDGGPAAPTYGNHAGTTQGRGRLVPWTTWGDAIARELKFYAACPSVGPYPSFAVASHTDGSCKPSSNDVIPGMQDGMGILSYLKAYVHGGRADASLLAAAKAMGDYLSKEALTPNTGVYPAVPRSTGIAGAMPQPPDCGSEDDDPYEIEPDKAGIAGHALMMLAAETKDTSYSDVALHSARVLVSNMAPGDATSSPWFFRVDYRTGIPNTPLVSSDMVYILRLFDDLIAAGYTEFSAPRAALWAWIVNYQIPNATCDGLLWVEFFEDMALFSNRNAWAPLSLARYLLEGKSAIDPDWRAHVDVLLSFVESQFTITDQGFHVGVEQDIDKKPFGGILSTYGAVNAMFAKATGSVPARERAYTALNLVIFEIDTDGCPGELALVSGRGGWQQDTHLDKIHNLMDALAAFPEWEN